MHQKIKDFLVCCLLLLSVLLTWLFSSISLSPVVHRASKDFLVCCLFCCCLCFSRALFYSSSIVYRTFSSTRYSAFGHPGSLARFLWTAVLGREPGKVICPLQRCTSVGQQCYVKAHKKVLGHIYHLLWVDRWFMLKSGALDAESRDSQKSRNGEEAKNLGRRGGLRESGGVESGE